MQLVLRALLVTILGLLLSACGQQDERTFTILASNMHKFLEPRVTALGRGIGIDVQMTYQRPTEIAREIQKGKASRFDAVWPASSLWMALGDTQGVLRYSQSIMRSPVVVAVRRPLAQQLGWVGETVAMRDIVTAAERGELPLAMTSPTRSSLGASAYLGSLHAAAGNPEVLTLAHLEESQVKELARRFLSAVPRESRGAGTLMRMFLANEGRFEAVFNHEFKVIEANRELIARGRPPLYAIYPVDGLTMVDSPLAYIDRGDAGQEQAFLELQQALLDEESQSKMLKHGRRPGRAGLDLDAVDRSLFNPQWGIDVERTLSPMAWPSGDVIREALRLLVIHAPAPVADVPPPAASHDLYPLRPADNSSPRDALRSFLANTNQGIQRWLAGGRRQLLTPHRIRALESLDISRLPDRHSASAQVQHALMLKEILDRIALPPDDQIPGDQAVADQGITSWTIPDTRITIAQVQEGPRKGEFLFTAHTVAQLEEMYRLAKHLPYQPGATEDVYHNYLDSIGASETDAARVRRLLKPADTSSPLSTFLGFWESLNRAYWLIMDADFAFRANPPLMSREEALEVEEQADFLIQRALRTLDLSQLPKAIRGDVGIEVALQLKDVLDRISRPPLDSIPDVEAVRDWKLDNKDMLSTAPKPFSWHFPNTEIEIVEVVEGPRAGEFLFSADTVSRADALYEKAHELPYRASATEGFYTFFISTPGYLVPDAYPLANWVDDLPPFFHTAYAEQTLWQWVGLVLATLAAIAGGVLAYSVTRRLSRRVQEPFEDWLKLLVPTLGVFTLFVIDDFINRGLNITGYVLSVVTTILEGTFYLLAAWAVYVLFKALAETVIATPRISDKGLDASLLRLGARLLGFLIGAWVLIDGLHELGVHIVPLLAGLGVGGLAVALAARPTIENIIGSLILFANRPVRVGDFCRYGEDPSPGWLRIGTVEEIGLHSTRLRGIDRTVTSIPNAEFSNMHIINLTKRDRMLFKHKIGLRYETTPEQLCLVLAALREMLLAHPRITKDPARVRASGFGPFSIDVDIFAYVNTADWNDFLAVQEDLVLRIMRVVKKSGTAFAFPSRTVYHTRDSGLDSERQQAAEQQMREWAAAQTLPFPEFPEAYREQITDTLDYPPKGSPDYKPRAGLPESDSELHGPPPPEPRRIGPRPGAEFEGN